MAGGSAYFRCVRTGGCDGERAQDQELDPEQRVSDQATENGGALGLLLSQEYG
ncbi:Uncharacterised protein [uncultured archaeon]|nr:Uncharacterised protein [uncultured archaeon]